jgi:hypothetical protein
MFRIHNTPVEPISDNKSMHPKPDTFSYYNQSNRAFGAVTEK